MELQYIVTGPSLNSFILFSQNPDSHTLPFSGVQGLQAREIPDKGAVARPEPAGGAQILTSPVQVDTFFTNTSLSSPPTPLSLSPGVC